MTEGRLLLCNLQHSARPYAGVSSGAANENRGCVPSSLIFGHRGRLAFLLRNERTTPAILSPTHIKVECRGHRFSGKFIGVGRGEEAPSVPLSVPLRSVGPCATPEALSLSLYADSFL